MKNLRRIRENRGLTGEQLGGKVNVKKSAISKYERGDIQPSQEVLIALAKVLDTSVDYLLGLTDNPEPSENLPTISIGDGGEKYVVDMPKNKIEKFKKIIDAAFDDEIKGI